MTRQPAVQVGVQFPVASDAKAHLEFYRLEPVHGLHVTVAVGTVQLRPQYVGAVMEEDEIGKDEDPDPGDRLFREIVFLLLENFRMVRNHVLVAEKAFFYRGQPGVLRALHVGVAEAAVDLLHPGMDAVAEEDRLLRADPFQGEKIVKIPHGCKKDRPDYQPYITAFHRSRLWIVVRHIRITEVRIQEL